MKTQKQFKIAGILIVSLGIVHIFATPVILPIFKILRLNEALLFTYMFVTTGIALVFTGWLQYFASKRLGGDRSIHAILTGTILFMSIAGIGAVATMWNNPFAYIILLIALYEVYLLKLIPRTL